MHHTNKEVLKDALGLFQEVMQDYRDEIKDFFAVDKQLAAELEYDMKKYNEQLAQEQALTEQANASRMGDDDSRTQAAQVREAAWDSPHR